MYATKRSGFAMILAIFVVVLVAGGGAMLLSDVTKGSKAVSDNYLRAQANLLADSATEFAVMRAQGFNRTGSQCLDQLNVNVNDASGNAMFDINISLSYSFYGSAIAGCTRTLASDTNKSTMILMDVTVATNATANLSTEPIRVHKRSWQKL